jgi:hypothetical protein
MRRFLSLLALPALAMQAPAPDPAELLQQAKGLWTAQGDREGAASKLEQAIALLSPRLAGLDDKERRLLCEAYNWLAVLDDRYPPHRARVSQHFQAILGLDPNFNLDRSATPARLNAAFEAERDARFVTVEVTVLPPGGTLSVNGKPAAPGTLRLPAGAHVFGYSKASHKALEASRDLQAGKPHSLLLELTRVASTISFNVLPIGAEIVFDGKVLGKSSGQAGPEARQLAEGIGVPLEQLSAPFLIEEVLPGPHQMDVRSPCFKPKRIVIEAASIAPIGDYPFNPIKLESSAARLSLTSPAKGGEAFLDGVPLGPLPLSQHLICPGRHSISVRFPAGGYGRTLDVPDGGTLVLEAVPKPRMAFLGMDGEPDFPGRLRLETQFRELGHRLVEVAVLPVRLGESMEEAKSRTLGAKEAELLLEARTRVRAGVTLVDLSLTTPEGLEERMEVKPLDQDPLEAFARKLNASLPLSEPGLGLVCLDVPGEPGPWVLQASEAALKAGIVLHQPLTVIQGQPVTTQAEMKRVLAGVTEPIVSVLQGDRTITLPLAWHPLEIPLHTAGLSYPRVVAELRLRLASASPAEAGLLRLNLARALLHFEKPDRALEVLRGATLPVGPGVSMGTIAYLTGICLLRLGSVYIPEAIQAFNQALQDPGATLFGFGGPPVAPLARAALQSNQP